MKLGKPKVEVQPVVKTTVTAHVEPPTPKLPETPAQPAVIKPTAATARPATEIDPFKSACTVCKIDFISKVAFQFSTVILVLACAYYFIKSPK